MEFIMDYLASATCREGSILQLTLDEKSVLRTPRTFPKNVCLMFMH